MLTALLGGALANAQNPLEGYNAPSYTGEGNAGNIVSFSTSGALEDLTNISIPKTPNGKIQQEILAAPGATVSFSVYINTFWGKFAMFSDANENKEMTRLAFCGKKQTTNFENSTTGVLVHVEDGETNIDNGTLPSVTIPDAAEDGTVYLLRMMFVEGDQTNPTYDGAYVEGTYYDVKITVKSNIQRYAINFTTPENGTLSIKNGETALTSGAEVAEGTILTIAATPNSGYELVSVKNNGEVYPNSTYMVNAAANFSAEFQTLATTGDDNNQYTKYSGVSDAFASFPLAIFKLSERYFLQAEAALRWGIGGAAAVNINYLNGIVAMFDDYDIAQTDEQFRNYWNQKEADTTIDYVDPHNSRNNKKGLISVGVILDNSDDDRTKLEKIITQKWLSMFPMGLEAWNDLRRTGYPRIFPVNDIGDGSLGNGRMIRRIPWNMTDAAAAQDVNTSGIEALGGSNLMRTTLWWDVEDPSGLGDNRRWETEAAGQ